MRNQCDTYVKGTLSSWPVIEKFNILRSRTAAACIACQNCISPYYAICRSNASGYFEYQ